MDVTDYKTSSLESNLIGINAITYVAGYLLKKCLLKHHCHICSTALVNNELTDSSQLFCMFKGYESKDKLFGGLVSPSSPFVNYIASIESKFIDEFANNVNKSGIGKYLLSCLNKFFMPQCETFPSIYLLKLFVRMRLHSALKFGNRELRSANKKSRKYLKVKHL